MKAFVDLRPLRENRTFRRFRLGGVALFPVINSARSGARPEVLGPFTTAAAPSGSVSAGLVAPATFLAIEGVTTPAATALIAVGAPALRGFTVSDEAKVSA